MSKVVAIHQPNFFPWLGYFDKIARSDAFIVLDNAQLSKTGGSWVNRVKLMVGDRDCWATAPIRRGSGVQTISDVLFDEHQPWRRKLTAMVQAAYRRAPFYHEAGVVIEELIANPETRVAAYNLHAITTIAERLGLPAAHIRLASDFDTVASSNELLIALTTMAGGDTYLCGGGAGEYQQDDLFGRAGVALRYQRFAPPPYPQHGVSEFVPGLSIIDALMNLGFAGTRRLIYPPEA